MSKRLQFLIALTLGVPVVAGAQVPVQDSSYGAAQSAGQGYGGAGAAGAGNGAPVSGMGQLFSQLQQMQDDISRLRGQLEVQENEIRQLKQEGLDRYQDLDGRISQLSSAPANAGAGAAAGSSQAQGGAIAANSTPTPPAAANAPAASSEPADPAKEKLYYEAAFDLIKSKDFDKASQAFNAFLRKYPNSQYAGNAQYWLGEVNLAKGDLQAAGQAFARVSQAYPTSNKVPDSLYKLAGVEQKLGRTDRAKGMYQQVISQYPGTSAAQLAQRDLKSLP
ncbi:tol-pal system protein YbgF [Pseudomonas oryzihabitans]|uniref:Cell division coordinator CpoB n=1 Tax=Pseudomonas oryzihabitans TaxID=47885 RepID=A0AAJ2EY55_9PSED|nr:tol-pal system protein YbgF [Pseudomonas psychrotolerans]MDR6236174.1 tol-pal system protein YbgF [Pseudomonas psychrotolerans]MDR6354494.1 tol-pal system protein YbgF [Pseudomonas psychrotolerans]MDR6680133.1 tol-pal system protein YbgF [Pseudomonas psychrotolerans]